MRSSRDFSRGVIYKKGSIDNARTIEVEQIVEELPVSEKSYDSEIELDLDAELAELERLEAEKTLAEEDAPEKDCIDSSTAGVGANFLNDLIAD